MLDYMKALKRQFDPTPKQFRQLERNVEAVRKKLSGQLDRPRRKLLLRLIDLKDAQREQACLNSFLSGYRLACGIHRELAIRPPYSFDEDETRRAERSVQKEVSHNGEAQSER